MFRMSLHTGLAISILLAAFGSAGAPGAMATERPFKARLAGNAMLSATDDPCVMLNNASALGYATHAGRFTWETNEKANFCTVPGGVEVAGTFTLSAANGDRIFGEFAAAGRFDETGTLLIDGSYEVVGGTGRFTGAIGTGSTEVIALFTPGLPFVASLSGTILY